MNKNKDRCELIIDKGLYHVLMGIDVHDKLWWYMGIPPTCNIETSLILDGIIRHKQRYIAMIAGRAYNESMIRAIDTFIGSLRLVTTTYCHIIEAG